MVEIGEACGRQNTGMTDLLEIFYVFEALRLCPFGLPRHCDLRIIYNSAISTCEKAQAMGQTNPAFLPKQGRLQKLHAKPSRLQRHTQVYPAGLIPITVWVWKLRAFGRWREICAAATVDQVLASSQKRTLAISNKQHFVILWFFSQLDSLAFWAGRPGFKPWRLYQDRFYPNSVVCHNLPRLWVTNSHKMNQQWAAGLVRPLLEASWPLQWPQK